MRYDHSRLEELSGDLVSVDLVSVDLVSVDLVSGDLVVAQDRLMRCLNELRAR